MLNSPATLIIRRTYIGLTGFVAALFCMCASQVVVGTSLSSETLYEVEYVDCSRRAGEPAIVTLRVRPVAYREDKTRSSWQLSFENEPSSEVYEWRTMDFSMGGSSCDTLQHPITPVMNSTFPDCYSASHEKRVCQLPHIRPANPNSLKIQDMHKNYLYNEPQ